MTIVLLTGEIGVGKTTLCERVVALSRQWDYRVAGMLSLPTFDASGEKAGIEIIDLASGERRTLARVGGGAGYELPVGKYGFDPAVLAWGNEIIAQPTPPDTLWVVDEIGWLEVMRGAGFLAALDKLRQPPVHTLVAVRQEVVARLRPRIAADYAPVFFVTRENRDTLARLVARRIWGRLV